MERLSELFLLFTRLGFIGFGGPQAHLALMQDEVQERRGWLTKEEFSDGLAVCNILPGPASTQMVAYIGWVRGGLRGGLVAAFSFIWPAFTMMLVLSWLYFNYGTLAQVNAFFYGLKPIVVAIVVATAWRLAKPALRDTRFLTIMLVTALLMGAQLFNDFLVFLGAALIGLPLYASDEFMLNRVPEKKGRPTSERGLKMGGFWVAFGLVNEQTISLLTNMGDFGRLAQLTWFFIRAGAFIFGGGLVIIPLIQNEVVQGYGWLTQQQFLDGVVLGQATPGPVLITAAFVGYATAGVIGALVATLAIFAPGLTLILLVAPSLKKVKRFPWARAALKGVNGAVVGSLLAGAYFTALTAFVLPHTSAGGFEMGKGKILDFYTLTLGLIALFLILRYKLNTIYLFLVAGGIGLLLSLLPFRLPGSGLPLIQ
ncbi:MAG: chromate efflux transporter [Chloroflexota bacterium]